MENCFIQIGYMDSRLSKSMKPLTAEVFEQLTTSEKVRQTMAQIEAETDVERKNELKQQLPVVLYACQLTANGQRPSAQNGLGVASGLCMHDWDHMPQDPRAFYMNRIAGREQQLGIVLVHVTPRGEGLRLVTVLKDDEQIVECQERVAAEFGMQQYADTKVKDITRLSYLPSQDYVLYVDVKGVFERTLSAPQGGTSPLMGRDGYLDGDEGKAGMAEAKTDAGKAEAGAAEDVKSADLLDGGQGESLSLTADLFMYDGVKYSTIIDSLLKRLATQGQPVAGERNNVLYSLVRELRHICDYNFQTIYSLVKPYFAELPDAEIRRTIASSLASAGRSITPVMRGVIAELKSQNVEDADVTEGLQLSKLPKLSAIEEMILSHYPKHLRAQVFLSMLPIWGVYGTNIRFDYMDGRENSLSFMTAVVGKSGSGKAFASHLFEQMTQRLQQQDAEERQKADEYLAMCNRMSDDAEKPEDPRPRVRLLGDDITTSQMLEYLDNNKGMHCIQFTEEVARLMKAKRTVYGDNDDLYCKSFDNGVGGKESKSKLTRNIRLKIYLNSLFCGTPGAMHKFYNNPEGGLNNRVIYAFMPKVRVKGFPNYRKLDEQERAQFDEVCDRLSQAGQDHAKVQLPWLEKVILNQKNRWDREDEENPDEVWYDLGKRSLVVAMRVGVLQWYLRGCPEDEKQQREIGRVVRWMAETMRASVYAFSGKDYETIDEQDNAFQHMQQSRMTKNRKLFSLLADAFTTQDLVMLRMQNGGSSDVRMVLSRWVADGLIRKVGDGRYQKLPQVARAV